MQSDPIVAEIRRLRELRASHFNFDISRIVKDVQARDGAGDRKVVRLPPRRPISSAARGTEAVTDGYS